MPTVQEVAITEAQFCDPINKGSTRPAMYKGVPLIPFLVVTFCASIASMLMDNPFAWLLILAAVPVMQAISAKDPQQWRLMGLWLWFRVVNLNLSFMVWGCTTYSPINRR